VRVVLDTNVLISAFLFPGGAPEAVYRLALEGRVELVTSRPLLAEFGRVLSLKFGWEDRMAEEAVAQVARIAVVVEPTQTVSQIRADPADDRVLEAAAEGQAGAIVSGDRHLLQIDPWRDIRVLSPAAFLAAHLGKPRPEGPNPVG
jgi:putative PIN family toxin of toxin-antitoxin system